MESKSKLEVWSSYFHDQFLDLLANKCYVRVQLRKEATKNGGGMSVHCLWTESGVPAPWWLEDTGSQQQQGLNAAIRMEASQKQQSGGQ